MSVQSVFPSEGTDKVERLLDVLEETGDGDYICNQPSTKAPVAFAASFEKCLILYSI